MGPIEKRILEKLGDAFQPVSLEVQNESHQHSVPKGSETHFRVVIVSGAFTGMSRVARSRAVHGALSEELRGGVHALTMRAFDPVEWASRDGVAGLESPPCFGGSKTDPQRS